MFRWGILSTAKIGRDHVIPQLQDSENGVVTAIASRDHARARAVADRAIIIEGGEKKFDGSFKELEGHPEIRDAYLSV